MELDGSMSWIILKNSFSEVSCALMFICDFSIRSTTFLERFQVYRK